VRGVLPLGKSRVEEEEEAVLRQDRKQSLILLDILTRNLFILRVQENYTGVSPTSSALSTIAKI
jgi:hypothetical protein